MAAQKTKSICFNVEDANELSLFRFAERKKNFSGYVKELLSKDMQRQANQSVSGSTKKMGT